MHVADYRPSRRLKGFQASALLAALLSVAPWAVTGAAPAGAETREFIRSFPVEGDRGLSLSNLAGSVKIEPGSGSDVRVRATAHVEASSAAETGEILESLGWERARRGDGPNRWAIAYPLDDYSRFNYPGHGSDDGEEDSFWIRMLKNFGGSTSTTYQGKRVRLERSRSSSAPMVYVDLVISMPRGTDLEVRNTVGTVDGGDLAGELSVDTGSGEVRISSFDGPLLVDTGSGDVWVGRARGRTSVDTGSGGIHVDLLEGDGEFDTGSGDVRIERAVSERLDVDTGSGDVFVDGGELGYASADTGSGDVRFSGVEVIELRADTGSGDVFLSGSLARTRLVEADTGSGDVTILGGPDAAFDVDVDLSSGDLVVRYTDTELRLAGREVVGARRGSGQTRILVDTGSGDCVIGPAD